jgi:hypothetical protein
MSENRQVRKEVLLQILEQLQFLKEETPSVSRQSALLSYRHLTDYWTGQGGAGTHIQFVNLEEDEELRRLVFQIRWSLSSIGEESLIPQQKEVNNCSGTVITIGSRTHF